MEVIHEVGGVLSIVDALGQHVDTAKGGVARLVEALEEPRLGIRSAVPLEQRVDFLKRRVNSPVSRQAASPSTTM